MNWILKIIKAHRLKQQAKVVELEKERDRILNEIFMRIFK